MAQTLTKCGILTAALLYVLPIARITRAVACPVAVANKSCKETVILQTNGTASFTCETTQPSQSEWWKIYGNECILFGTREEQPKSHNAFLHDNFTLNINNTTHEDTANYFCVYFEDIIASYCLVEKDEAKIVDGDWPITVFETNELNITCKTGPAYPAVNISWILNGTQYPAATIETKNEDGTMLVKQFTSVTTVNISCTYRSSNNLQIGIKSIVVHFNAVLPILRITINGKNVTGTFDAQINQENKIECIAYGGRLSVNLTWKIDEESHTTEGTLVSENLFNDNTFDSKLSLEDIPKDKGCYNITCSSYGRYPEQETSFTLCVKGNVLPTLRITINGKNVTRPFDAQKYQENKIECIAYRGKPSVNLTWKIDEEPHTTERTIVSENLFDNNTFDSKLSLEDIPKDIGCYNITCSSYGRYPEQETSFTLCVKGNEQKTQWWLLCILLPTFSLLLIAILLIAWRHRRHKLEIEKSISYQSNDKTWDNLTITTFEKDGQNSVPMVKILSKEDSEEVEELKDVKRYEVSMMTTLHGRSYLQYFKGNFNRSGKTRNIIVKTVKEDAYVKNMYTFVKCCGLMQCLPRHENVIALLGISMEEMPIYSYHDYVEGVTLRDFLLRNFQSSTLDKNSIISGQSPENDEARTSEELFVFAENVANGMDFLMSHNFSHPALSTRKVLLNTKGQCRIYDIWPEVLATERMIYLLQRENAPLAWMAPECIFLKQYHLKTDVWSYGVLLWELFSFGETPFNTMNNYEIEQELRKSRHLHITPNCPGAIFSLMLSSWNKECDKRPSFKEILQVLRRLLGSFEQEEEKETAESLECYSPNEEYFKLEEPYSDL